MLNDHKRAKAGKRAPLTEGRAGIPDIRDRQSADEASDSSVSSIIPQVRKGQPGRPDPLKISTYTPNSQKYLKYAKVRFVVQMNLYDPFPNEAACLAFAKTAFNEAAAEKKEHFAAGE